MSSPNLLAVYGRTSAGNGELAAPANGLSINQRKFLQWSDGQASVSSLAERLANGHEVETAKVVRDFERLEALGLISPIGAGVSAANATAIQTNKSRKPLVFAGVGAVVLVGGLLAFANHKPEPTVAQQVAANSAQSAELAPEETEAQIFGVMPNPARWFSPGAKPEPKPAEPKPSEAKPVATLPALNVAAAKPAAPVVDAKKPAAPAPAEKLAAPEPVAVNTPPAAAESKSSPAPAQVASAAPAAAPTRPEPAAPNKKPVYRETPEFPREALREGIESGSVQARLSVNEAGKVTKVEIIEAKPRRVFDRAVIAALSRWRFQPAAAGFTVDTEVAFSEN
jgi:TonB family protein